MATQGHVSISFIFKHLGGKMIVFEKPDGYRIAIDSFDIISINELYSGRCSISYNGLNLAENPEGLIVIGQFEELLAKVDETEDDEPWRESL